MGKLFQTAAYRWICGTMMSHGLSYCVNDSAPDPRLLADLLRTIDTQYPLHDVRIERRLSTKGERRAYILAAADGPFVAKLSAPAAPEERVRCDVETLAYLAGFHFPSPAPRRTTDGRLYVPLGDRWLYLYHYLEGTLPCANDSFYRALGRLLAHLHSLPIERFPFETAYSPHVHMPAILASLTEREQAGNEAASHLLAIARDLVSFDALPRGVIHTDPYFINLVLDERGRLSLIDWDDAGIGLPILDVGYVIAHLCCFLPGDRVRWGVEGEGEIVWRPDWARLFLEAYGEVRTLSEAEQGALQAAALFSVLEYIAHPPTGEILMPNYRRIVTLLEQQEFWARVTRGRDDRCKDQE